jgi:hypothetical protein
LITAVWSGRIVSDSALTTRINAARRAIGDSGEKQRLIKTLPLKGVRFVGEVREEQRAPGVTATTTGATLALPDRPSIAVLPLNNTSGDKEQDYFSDGITEDIITELSRFSDLFVIAHNSSLQYKGRRSTYAKSDASLACTTSCREAFAAGVTEFESRCSSLMPRPAPIAGPSATTGGTMFRAINESKQLNLPPIFERVRIRGGKDNQRVAFAPAFVQARILADGIFGDLNPEARRVIYLPR